MLLNEIKKTDLPKLPEGEFYTEREHIVKWIQDNGSWGPGQRIKASDIKTDDGKVIVKKNLRFHDQVTELKVQFYQTELIAFMNNYESSTPDEEWQPAQLKSLKGLPVKMNSSLILTDTGITSLKYCPQVIHGNLEVNYNSQLKSLEHAPAQVGGSFDCSKTGITSLKHGPNTVEGDYICSLTEITSLEGIAKDIEGDIDLGGCTKLTSLSGIDKMIHKMDGKIYVKGTGITKGMIGALKIPGFQGYSLVVKSAMKTVPIPKELKKAVDIINKYVGQGLSGVVKCQRELIEADLDDYAED